MYLMVEPVVLGRERFVAVWDPVVDVGVVGGENDAKFLTLSLYWQGQRRFK